MMNLKTFNIKKFFIKKIKNKLVKIKVIKVDNSTINIGINLNGISKIIPMQYIVKNNIIKASGVIDALDFNLKKRIR